MFALEGFTWGDGLGDAWSKVVTTAPKVVYFLLILIVGRIVAGFARRTVYRLLERVGFPRLVERAGMRAALSSAQDNPSGLVARLVYYALMLWVLTTAFAVFGSNNPVSLMLGQVVAFLPRVFVATAIVVVAGFLARIVRDLLAGALDDVPHGALLARSAGVAVLVIGGFAALSQLGIAPAIVNGLFYAALAVVVGSAIVAIGGGGIGPMRRQWEKSLDRIERGTTTVIDLREETRIR